jgi:hypothetical protein
MASRRAMGDQIANEAASRLVHQDVRHRDHNQVTRGNFLWPAVDGSTAKRYAHPNTDGRTKPRLLHVGLAKAILGTISDLLMIGMSGLGGESCLETRKVSKARNCLPKPN